MFLHLGLQQREAGEALLTFPLWTNQDKWWAASQRVRSQSCQWQKRLESARRKVDKDLQILWTSTMHQVRCSKAEFCWQWLLCPRMLRWTSCLNRQHGFKAVCVPLTIAKHQFACLCSQTLPQWGRFRAENKEWPQDITTPQESGLRSTPPGSKIADSEQSRIANICIPRWRREESSQWSMISHLPDLSPDVQYRTKPLNAKFWHPSGVSLSLFCSGEREYYSIAWALPPACSVFC